MTTLLGFFFVELRFIVYAGSRRAEKLFNIESQTAGDKAKKFIPMKRELSDEDFERRVRVYYQI